MKKIVVTALLSGVLVTAPALCQEELVLTNWSPPPYWSPHASSGPQLPDTLAEPQDRHATRHALALPSSPLPFVAIAPCREYDSRSSTPLVENTPRTVTLTGAPCGIPAAAQAAAVNITVFNITGAGSNGVFKVDTVSPPTTAWINFPKTETQRANAGVVALTAAGAIVVQVNQGSGFVDFVVDVAGYYAPQGIVNSLNTLNGDVTLAQGSNVTITPSGQTLTISASGGGGGGLPAGSSGQTLRHDGSSWVASSFLTNTGSAVGIGISSPGEQLHITGNIRLPQTTSTTGQIKMAGNRFIHGYGALTNTFVGLYAGDFFMTGNQNTGIGYGSMANNASGYDNTGVGNASLQSASTGYGNTAAGSFCLFLNSAGQLNTAVGNNALRNSTTASRNTAVGASALYTQSYDNSGTPWNAENTAVGYQALYANQPTGTANGSQNTAVGAYALQANTTGTDNTAVGTAALRDNTTGSSNVAVGGGSSVTASGSENTSVGSQALHVNTTGAGNTALGRQAMGNNGTGSQNVAVGVRSLQQGLAGSYNVAVGAGAGFYQTGDRNTAVGMEALHAAGASGNVGLGYRAGYNETGSNRLHIANTDAKTLIYGQFDTDRVGINATDPTVTLDVNGRIRSRTIGTSTGSSSVCYDGTGILGACPPSDVALKMNIVRLSDAMDVLAGLSALRGVRFTWDRSLPKVRSLGGGPEIGVIAQEVETVLPEVVSTTADGYKSVDYPKLTAFLIEVAKAQQKEIESLKGRLETLERMTPPSPE